MLIVSKYTKGKASQARVILKKMDLITGQVLAEKLRFSTPDTEQLCQDLLPLPDLQAKEIIQTTRTPPCYFFSFRCQEVWKTLVG